MLRRSFRRLGTTVAPVGFPSIMRSGKEDSRRTPTLTSPGTSPCVAAAPLSSSLHQQRWCSSSAADVSTEKEKKISSSHGMTEEEVWELFNTSSAPSSSSATPPPWFEQLCRDLHFRTNTNDEFDDDSAKMAPMLYGGDMVKRTTDARMPDNIKEEEEGEGRKKSTGGQLSEDDEASSTSLRDIATGETLVDPFLWLDFNLRDVSDYSIESYKFSERSLASPEQEENGSRANRGPAELLHYAKPGQKEKLLLNQPVDKKYICFCEAYSFPDRAQIPTSVGNVPCKLWVDPTASQAVVFIQLSEHYPPAMWLPVKGTAQAVRRVLAEFAQRATIHRDTHHLGFEAKKTQAIQKMKLQNLPGCGGTHHIEVPREKQRSSAVDGSMSPMLTETKEIEIPPNEGAVLRYMGKDARTAYTVEVDWKEYPNYQEFYMGEHADPEHLLEYMDTCPFTFALPLMRTVTKLTDERYTPTISGPGIGTNLYRTIHSKSLLFVKAHLGTEVKLPPQDLDSFRYLWKDADATVEGQLPESRVPIFCRAVWPVNQRMCGGGGVVQRFNDLMGTEFSLDMPIDTVMSLYFTMAWARRSDDLLGIQGMRKRLAEVERACFEVQTPKLYPGTRDITNPDYTPFELLGMHVQYLAHIGDPEIDDTIRRLRAFGSAPVRMGCAKAALESGNKQLFREIVSTEPVGRMQDYMTKIVVKRKARDLTDPQDRYLDHQYEFNPPLWSGPRRLDPKDRSDAVTMARMKSTGRYGANFTKGVKDTMDGSTRFQQAKGRKTK